MKMVSLVWKFVCYNEIMVIEVRYVIINTQCSAKRTNWEVQTPYEAKVTSPSKRGKLTIGKKKSSLLLWTKETIKFPFSMQLKHTRSQQKWRFLSQCNLSTHVHNKRDVSQCNLSTHVHNKRDDLFFPIVNFPLLDGDVFLSSFLILFLIFVFPLVLLCTANLYSILWFILSLYAMMQISKEMRLNSCT
jgi:hypothetical protein